MTTPGDPGLFGPQWLQGVAIAAGVLLGLPSLVLPVVWLPFGLLSQRPSARFRSRRAGWIVGTAAAFVLEAVAAMGVGVPALAPDYAGAPVVSWIQLADSASYLVIGVALVASLTVKPKRGLR